MARRTVTPLRPDDPQWRELSLTAQWLVATIAVEPWRNAAGIAMRTERRWSNTCTGVSQVAVEAAMDELADAGWVVLDEEHVWLATYLDDNGIFRQPNQLKAALKAAAQCPSVTIREAVATQVIERAAESPALVVGRRRKAIDPSMRLEVYERDAWTCQDCRRYVPPTTTATANGTAAPFDELGWLELDHLHPHSDGGEDTVDNLRALCGPCNRRKGVRSLLRLVEEAV